MKIVAPFNTLIVLSILMLLVGLHPLTCQEINLSSSSLNFVDRIFALELEKERLVKKIKTVYYELVPEYAELAKLSRIPTIQIENFFASKKNEEIHYFAQMKSKIQNFADLYELFNRRKKQNRTSVDKLKYGTKYVKETKVMPLIATLKKFMESYEINVTLYKSKLEDLAQSNQDIKDRFSDLRLSQRLYDNLTRVKTDSEKYSTDREKRVKEWDEINLPITQVNWPEFSSRPHDKTPLSTIYQRSYDENEQLTSKKREGIRTLKQNYETLNRAEKLLWGKEQFISDFLEIIDPFFKEADEQVQKMEDLLNYAVSAPSVKKKDRYRQLLQKVSKFLVVIKKSSEELKVRVMNLIVLHHQMYFKLEEEFYTYSDNVIDLMDILTQIQKRNLMNLKHLRQISITLPLYLLSIIYEQITELKNFLTNGGLATTSKFALMAQQFQSFMKLKGNVYEEFLNNYKSFRKKRYFPSSTRSYLKDLLKTFEDNETRILTIKNRFNEILLKEQNDQISQQSQLYNKLKIDLFGEIFEVEKIRAIYSFYVDEIKNRRIMNNFTQNLYTFAAFVGKYEKQLHLKIKADNLLARGSESELAKTVRIYQMRMNREAEKSLVKYRSNKKILQKMIQIEMKKVKKILAKIAKRLPGKNRKSRHEKKEGGEISFTITASGKYDPIKDRAAALTNRQQISFRKIIYQTRETYEKERPVRKLIATITKLDLSLKKIINRESRWMEAPVHRILKDNRN